MNVTIEGIGVLGGFGCGTGDLMRALTAQRPSARNMTLDTSEGPIEIPALRTETDLLTDFLPKKELRRIGHYARMALLGCYLALDDAGMLAASHRDLGIIVATGYGATCNTFDFQHSVLNHPNPCGSPTKFSNSVHNAAAAHISIFLGSMGPNLSLSHYDMSMASAFFNALLWLEEERVDTVVVGGVDEFCNVLGYYWHCHTGSAARRYLPHSQAPSTYAVIGEGACFFVLRRVNKGSDAYARIAGVQMGSTNGRIPPLSGRDVYLIGADGYSECDHRYADWLPPDARVAAYTDVYGGLPVGMGFDVAIAALSLQSRQFFAPSKAGDTPQIGSIARVPEALSASDRFTCLKLGAADAYGWISLVP